MQSKATKSTCSGTNFFSEIRKKQRSDNSMSSRFQSEYTNRRTMKEMQGRLTRVENRQEKMEEHLVEILGILKEGRSSPPCRQGSDGRFRTRRVDSNEKLLTESNFDSPNQETV